MLSVKIWGMYKLPGISYLWWKLMPGTKIKVKWPSGPVVVNFKSSNWEDCGGANNLEIESADPNDHYRPWMEKHVGRQGWDWNWALMEDDINTNRLTIKFRKGKEKYATIVAMKWL